MALEVVEMLSSRPTEVRHAAHKRLGVPVEARPVFRPFKEASARGAAGDTFQARRASAVLLKLELKAVTWPAVCSTWSSSNLRRLRPTRPPAQTRRCATWGKAAADVARSAAETARRAEMPKSDFKSEKLAVASEGTQLALEAAR